MVMRECVRVCFLWVWWVDSGGFGGALWVVNSEGCLMEGWCGSQGPILREGPAGGAPLPIGPGSSTQDPGTPPIGVPCRVHYEFKERAVCMWTDPDSAAT